MKPSIKASTEGRCSKAMRLRAPAFLLRNPITRQQLFEIIVDKWIIGTVL
jgi:hypothetical protein